MATASRGRSRIRKATGAHAEALFRLEWEGFSADRFDRQQIRHLLTRANATTWLVEANGAPQGAAIMLWREGSRVGHLYSIVVHPKFRRLGLGRKLLSTCELEARRRACERMTLEVRVDNVRARRFYERRGYRVTEYLPAYYEGGNDGLRMEKPLRLPPSGGPRPRPAAERRSGILLDVPYYRQSLEFTCGPACLMMAMKYLDRGLRLSRSLELTLWKEATLVYMTSGIGGCDPFGLALAARHRGHRASVYLSDGRIPFLSSVRKPEKRAVIRLVHQELRARALELGVHLEHSVFPLEEMVEVLRRRAVPIVLISTYRLHGVRAPHWVVVSGVDGKNVYFHDPYEAFYLRNNRRGRHVAVPVSEFRRMQRYGKDMKRIAVLVSGPARETGPARERWRTRGRVGE
ncbi:MAG: GNAT family N-acetyltransferase/peptidase C39 family protein [Gemmatimonadetes bacterium]|nr:GNAT family N-acetyltransferase/peptidase C39 family protein [Gemmatimonadota bacterium]